MRRTTAPFAWSGFILGSLSLTLGCGPDIEEVPRAAQSGSSSAAAGQAVPGQAIPGQAAAPAGDGVAAASAGSPPGAGPNDPAMNAPAGSPREDVDSTEVPTPAELASKAPPPEPGASAGPREAAVAGVGEKGRGYGGGIVTEPVHQYFQQGQRIVFEVQIPKAMQLWKAEHNNRGPATHAQFMKQIIEANSITLPDLPPGDRYVYDPQQETLMVEHPAK